MSAGRGEAICSHVRGRGYKRFVKRTKARRERRRIRQGKAPEYGRYNGYAC